MNDTALDRRLHAYREDMASRALKGQVDAQRFVDGKEHHVIGSVIDLRPRPDASVGIDTQLLRGMAVQVFDEAHGWSWCQARDDGYVGYTPSAGLKLGTLNATHRVCVPRTFTYALPDMKTPRQSALSLGTEIKVDGKAETRGTHYVLTSDGEAIIADHIVPIDDKVTDFVSVAEALLHAPYLWGGASAFGIDCSGLVQLSMRMGGEDVLRDTDMQCGSVGTALDDQNKLQRGDLVFWKGHVAIMRDDQTIIHANGHTMSVAIEPLSQAIKRIEYLYGEPTAYRRP